MIWSKQINEPGSTAESCQSSGGKKKKKVEKKRYRDTAGEVIEQFDIRIAHLV